MGIEKWAILQVHGYTKEWKIKYSNLPDETSSFDEYAEHYVNWIVANAEPKAIKLKEIEDESSTDKTIQAIKRAIFF